MLTAPSAKDIKTFHNRNDAEGTKSAYAEDTENARKNIDKNTYKQVSVGDDELEAIRKTGRSLGSQAADMPFIIRDGEDIGYIEPRPKNNPLTLAANQKFFNENHSITSSLNKVESIFTNSAFYKALYDLQKNYDSKTGGPYHDEESLHEIEDSLKTIYNLFKRTETKRETISNDELDTTYHGDLLVRLLDGHLGMIDTDPCSYTSRIIHGALLSATESMDKNNIKKQIDRSFNHTDKPKQDRDNDWVLTMSNMRGLTAHSRKDIEKQLANGNISGMYQGATDFHFDIAKMFALQAERWSLNSSNYSDKEFQLSLCKTVKHGIETAYASRALKMLEALDDADGRLSEDEFTLSHDDAQWLKTYSEDRQNSDFKYEAQIAKALGEHIDFITNAINNNDNDNTNSILNTGYNLREDGESLEHEAALKYFKYACENNRLDEKCEGRRSAKQLSDAEMIYTEGYGGYER